MKEKRHIHKSVFDDEQELLMALLELHVGKLSFDLDPMYFKGNFYKRVARPKYYYDINQELCGDFGPEEGKPTWGDATNLHWFPDGHMNSIILDPPFMFGGHGKQARYYSSSTHGILTWDELQELYKGILKEAHRLLKKGGTLVFKCQDYTDSKTTFTHCLVWQWAQEQGFYAKDLAILNLPKNKVANPYLKQKHLRKVHSYFWVFKKV